MILFLVSCLGNRMFVVRHDILAFRLPLKNLDTDFYWILPDTSKMRVFESNIKIDRTDSTLRFQQFTLQPKAVGKIHLWFYHIRLMHPGFMIVDTWDQKFIVRE